MFAKVIFVLAFLASMSSSSRIFSLHKLRSYASMFGFIGPMSNETDNELWRGILRDCKERPTFTCIQKNAYGYLDGAFEDRDNITLFDGLILRKNALNYDTCRRAGSNDWVDVEENLVDGSKRDDCLGNPREEDQNGAKMADEADSRGFEDKARSPIEEISDALRRKAIRFLATKDYEVQLPEFFFEGATVKLRPREVDESGALVRIDFGQRALESEGRIFKKIKKFIQGKLLMSFLALLLIIKLIKVKFMFVIPFLFGVGAAKKLFLKLVLFLVPAFAHVFKLCSSYYTSHGTKYYHHHHQIAHHHHHVPVPVPVPTYYHPPSHHHDDQFDGYDYAHPHIQYRKDMEELKEWGIEPYEEPYDNVIQNAPQPVQGVVQGQSVAHGSVLRPVPAYPGESYGLSQYAANARPIVAAVPSSYSLPHSPSNSHHDQNRGSAASAHNLAYSGYLEDKFNRRSSAVVPATSHLSIQQMANNNLNNNLNSNLKNNLNNILNNNLNNKLNGNLNNNLNNKVLTSITLPKTTSVNPKNPYATLYAQQNVPRAKDQSQRVGQSPVVTVTKSQPMPAATVTATAQATTTRQKYDDDFYGPITGRLDEIFAQLRFHEENCRERLVCSMYKSPTLYSPHSNLVSNELSRDPQELKHDAFETASSKKFHRYLHAARLGQDGGDCLRTYPCHINTE